MSNCDCIVVENFELNGPEFFSLSEPTAKKEHKCTECGQIINIGEKYTYETGKWDGEFLVFKTCSDCISVRNEMFCKNWEYGNIWSDVYDYLSDVNYQVSEDCLLSLTPKARNQILDIIDENWGDET